MLRTFRIAGLEIKHVIIYFIGQSWFAEPRYYSALGGWALAWVGTRVGTGVGTGGRHWGRH